MNQNNTENRHITEYNKQEIYREKILPNVNMVMSLCSSLGIPAFMTFAVENSAEGTVYDRKIVHAVARTELKDDTIASLLLKINGFRTTYPDYIQDAIRTISEYLDCQQVEHLEIKEPEEEAILQKDNIIEFSNFIGGNCGAADSKDDGSDDALISFH